jgi:hypothetical protein
VGGNDEFYQQAGGLSQLTHCANSTRSQRCSKYFMIFSLLPTTMSSPTRNKSQATPSSKLLLDISGSWNSNLLITWTWSRRAQHR